MSIVSGDYSDYNSWAYWHIPPEPVKDEPKKEEPEVIKDDVVKKNVILPKWFKKRARAKL